MEGLPIKVGAEVVYFRQDMVEQYITISFKICTLNSRADNN